MKKTSISFDYYYLYVVLFFSEITSSSLRNKANFYGIDTSNIKACAGCFVVGQLVASKSWMSLSLAKELYIFLSSMEQRSPESLLKLLSILKIFVQHQSLLLWK